MDSYSRHPPAAIRFATAGVGLGALAGSLYASALIARVGWRLFPIGAVLGGLVARVDPRVPFWIGGALVAVVILVAERLVLSVDSRLESEI